MTRLPWFPFYVDDFLASPKVRLMSVDEIGVYLLLLCEQHQRGHVEWPCDRIAPALRGHEQSVEYVLSQCFEQGPKGWQNPRLRGLKLEQEARSQKARESAKARWHKGSDANAYANAKRTQSDGNAIQSHSHNQITTVASQAKPKRGSALPDDWQPTAEHAARAKRENVDLAREVEKFRAHAEATGRVLKNWNAGFTTWLLNAKGFAPRNTQTDDRDEWADKEIKRFREKNLSGPVKLGDILGTP